MAVSFVVSSQREFFNLEKKRKTMLKDFDVKLEIKRRISIENETVNKYAYV